MICELNCKRILFPFSIRNTSLAHGLVSRHGYIKDVLYEEFPGEFEII